MSPKQAWTTWQDHVSKKQKPKKKIRFWIAEIQIISELIIKYMYDMIMCIYICLKSKDHLIVQIGLFQYGCTLKSKCVVGKNRLHNL